ncbi:hypothetical protein [Myxococcus sp. Y35]|uniref:hypothetical protein n=1 Tax=Pseudomyxococcus flavus TaxID=3115648 RepID=UPI003CF9F393
MVAAVLLTWSMALGGCGKSKAREALATKLEQRIRTASEAGGTFHLPEVTDFDWDTLHIFTPYVGADEVRKWLGIEWSGARDVPESECLLVFVKGDEVVMDLDFPRVKGDFADLKKHRLSRNEARFAVPQGGMRLENAVEAL